MRLNKLIRFLILPLSCASLAMLVFLSSSWAQNLSIDAITNIINIRFGINENTTRIVMDMDGKAEFTAFYLPDPYRLVLDLPEVNFKINTKTLKRSVSDIEGYRFGLFEKGTSRVVIDLAKPMVIIKSFKLEPNSTPWRRLVIDLRPVTQKVFITKSVSSIQKRSTKKSFNNNSKQQLILKK